MVDESLKQYFKTHLGLEDDERINKLFSDEEGNPFNGATTEKLVSLIDSLRAVDPAVGSGAFPMRLLNRLVFLLHKLDPDNKLWKKSQIDGIKKSVKDPILQRKFIEQIEKKFSEKNPDYGRKLYLIEKCIYGVDIQQIAVEIAKLRFFISLLVDEKTSPITPLLGKERGWGEVENYGIEPLPNLDFKLMQGNSLISSFAGIDFNTKTDEEDNLFTFDDHYKKLIEEFEELKSQYQNEPDVEAKRKLKDDIDKKLIEIFEEKLNQHFPQLKDINEKAATIKNEAQRKEYIEKEKKNLFKKIGIDLDQAEKDLIAYTEGRKQKNFFLWDVYFAEVFTDKGGFDIVIGNPPYIDSETMTRNAPTYREMLKENYESAVGNWDIFVIFIEAAILLLKKNGILAFIVSNKLLSKKYSYKIRELLNEKAVLELRDYSNVDVFKEADIYPITIIVKNSKSKDFNTITTIFSSITTMIKKNTIPNKLFSEDVFWDKYFFDTNVVELLIKISNGIKLKDRFRNIFGAATVNEAYMIKEVLEEFSNQKEYFRFINTGTIDPYTSLWGIKNLTYLNSSFVRPVISKNNLHKINVKRFAQAVSPKIIVSGMAIKVESFLDLNGKYCAGKSTSIILGDLTDLKYLVALLNSKLITFWFTKYFNSLSMAGGYFNIGPNEIGLIPLPSLSSASGNLIRLVENLIYLKNLDAQADTKHLEDQIDIMVYKLYELTYEEVKIIDPEIEKIISKEEYERFEIK
jgi:adenine-specific DNA-methyltransferase